METHHYAKATATIRRVTLSKFILWSDDRSVTRAADVTRDMMTSVWTRCNRIVVCRRSRYRGCQLPRWMPRACHTLHLLVGSWRQCLPVVVPRSCLEEERPLWPGRKLLPHAARRQPSNTGPLSGEVVSHLQYRCDKPILRQSIHPVSIQSLQIRLVCPVPADGTRLPPLEQPKPL